MRTIDNDIKNHDFKKIYLLYGSEHYLLRQYKAKIEKAFFPEEDSMNHSTFEGEGMNPKEVIDLAETLPFFAEKRLIVIENSGWLKKGGEDLAEYMGQCPDSTCFLFVEEEIDKRNKLYKQINKYGKIVEFSTQSEETLMRWVGSRLRKEGKNMTKSAYELFIAKTGADMQTIDRELEKLVCFCMDKDKVEVSDVEAITTKQVAAQVFDMVDAIADHKQRVALDLYYDILAQKEPPMRILFLMMRQFQNMLMVKSMSGQGFSNKEIAAKVGCPEWVVRNKYLRQCRSFSVERMKEALRDGAAYEEQVKTGLCNDRLAVELLIVQYSANEKKPSV